jgi:hypothetical protein
MRPMGFFFALAMVASTILAASSAAKAVTYGATTLSVPVTIDAPVKPGTPFEFQIYCSSAEPNQHTHMIGVTPLAISVNNGRYTYSGDVPIKLKPGLVSGTTINCWMHVDPSTVAVKWYDDKSDWDKATTHFVLP